MRSGGDSRLARTDLVRRAELEELGADFAGNTRGTLPVPASTLWLLYRARDRAVLESYTISDCFVAIEQASGGRVAIAVEDLTDVTIAGDKVRLESRDGVVTLGFVHRQRGLLRALERVAPGMRVERDMDVFCPP